MEVRGGYKQTDVGVIPIDWEVRALGTLGSVIRGSSPRPKSDRRFYGGDIPRLMVEDVTRDRKFVTPSIDFLTVEGAKRSRPCKRGTLTVVCSGTPAVVGLPSFLAVDACIHDGMMALINISPMVVPDYLFHLLTSYQEQLFSAATHGGTFVNLTTAGFRAFEIALPPTQAEQRAIADAISDMDALLGALVATIAKKRDLKQAAAQRLLTGQTRLPGFHGKWEIKRLGEAAEVVMGQSPDSRYYNRSGDGVPLIQGNADIEDRRSIARVWTTQISKEGRRGDLLLTVRAPVGSVALVTERCCLGRGVCALRPRSVYRDFLFQALIFEEGAWKVLEQGSTFTSANSQQVTGFKLNLPTDLKEQMAIAEVLSDMDAEIAALEARRAKTRALKQGMMQELLTGRTRLV